MKKWYKSKTYWFNIALASIGLLEANAQFISTQLTPILYGYIMIVIGFVGIALRAVTTTQIKGKDNV